jgi:hypothetical protein
MQREPVQFGAMNASRAKRSAAGVALSHRMRESSREASTSTVLDEVFATYSRVDVGTSKSDSPVTSVPSDWRATRELIADISTQLTALDSQRRQLARLLGSVDTYTTV